MKRMVAGFALALALSAGTAVADGMDKKAGTSCCTAAKWTGLYIGAGVGAGAVVHDLSVFGLSFDGIGGEGIFGTVTVGYDMQINSRLVAGLFADYDFSDISTTLSAGGFSASADHKHSWSVGGRLGILTAPTTLWYGTVGYTQAKFEINSTLGAVPVPDFSGYFVGGGVESQLGGGWAVRGEYRFSQFDSETIAGFVDVEPSMHTARVSLTYKFGDRREEARAPLK
jgi:outer membrane immunogenic protein